MDEGETSKEMAQSAENESKLLSHHSESRAPLQLLRLASPFSQDSVREELHNIGDVEAPLEGGG